MIEISDNGVEKRGVACEQTQRCNEHERELTSRGLIHKYRCVQWGIALIYIAVITVCGIMPVPRPVATVGFYGVDKLLHAGAYAIMVLVIANACKHNRLLVASGLSLLHGVSIEYVQTTLAWHQWELMDIIADMIGIAIGGVVWRVVNKLRV
ncbi:MAG TPA: hypothetical protein EYP10_15450 [Armatimonadetes bacterium]|nr:hypothetical protein [Armatimonadota bacterium]